MKITAKTRTTWRHLALGFALALVASFAFANGAAAHAEPVRADPPINGVVAASPAQVEIWFSEEATDATTIKVFAPDGVRVDLGGAKLDLQDPQRVHVTVGVSPHLDPGTYRVEWNSVSGQDGDAASGSYTFTIGTATPVASPQASPVATPIGTPQVIPAAVSATPAPTSTAVPEQFRTNKIDDQALAIAVGAGIVAAVAIYLFWRLLRPKHPVV